MIINKSNCEIVNSSAIYLHDDLFLNLNYDKDKKTIVVSAKKFENGESYEILFSNVIGVFSTGCDLWGKHSDTAFVDIFSNTDNQYLIPKLVEFDEKDTYDSRLNYENFIEIGFQFFSGDELIIACEQMEIESL